jgi:plasmid stabilization system protein ParE
MGRQKKTTAETYQVRISDNALKNIDEITGYIAFINLEPLNAIKVGDAIIRTIERIEQTPYAFRECEYLLTKSKMYRRAVCLSWLIIYKITITEIIVLGVMHGSRKPSAVKTLRKVK